MKLHPQGGGRWQLRDGSEQVADYDWQEMRFSISWKAYCFADEADRNRWRQAEDDLSLDTILQTLKQAMRVRGRPLNDGLEPQQLATALVNEFIHFPPPADH